MQPQLAPQTPPIDPAIVFTSCELLSAQQSPRAVAEHAPLQAAAASAGSGTAQPGVKRREVVVKGRRVKTDRKSTRLNSSHT